MVTKERQQSPTIFTFVWIQCKTGIQVKIPLPPPAATLLQSCYTFMSNKIPTIREFLFLM